jgi:hypothetical protein
MTDKDNSATKQVEAILAALQRSLLEASDEEIVKELRAAGVDPLKAMEVMNFADERAIDEHFRRLREGLVQKRAESLRKIEAARGRLPGTRAARLDLVRAICNKHPQTVTAQFRELTSFDNVSDGELASMLEHFAVLGYLFPEDAPK